MILISSVLASNRNANAYNSIKPFNLENFPALLYKPSLTSPRLCGIEVELEELVGGNLNESVYNKLEKEFAKQTGITIGTMFDVFWRTHADGSLRNNGLEYVTTLGTSFEYASVSTLLLETYLRLFEPHSVANVRTGLHVHVDVRDFRLIDIQKLLMLYLCYEESIFNYSGRRQQNIFCVPFSETNFPLNSLPPIHETKHLRSLLEFYAKKYMGLNLLPITTQGTVEFRMHHGTKSSKEMNNWLLLISNLFDFVVANRETSPDNLLDILVDVEEHPFVLETLTKAVFKQAHELISPYVDFESFRKGLNKVKEMYVIEEDIPEEFLYRKKKKKLRAGILDIPDLGPVFRAIADEDVIPAPAPRQPAPPPWTRGIPLTRPRRETDEEMWARIRRRMNDRANLNLFKEQIRDNYLIRYSREIQTRTLDHAILSEIVSYVGSFVGFERLGIDYILYYGIKEIEVAGFNTRGLDDRGLPGNIPLAQRVILGSGMFYVHEDTAIIAVDLTTLDYVLIGPRDYQSNRHAIVCILKHGH